MAKSLVALVLSGGCFGGAVILSVWRVSKASLLGRDAVLGSQTAK